MRTWCRPELAVALTLCAASVAGAAPRQVRVTLEPDAPGLAVTYRLDERTHALRLPAPPGSLTVTQADEGPRVVHEVQELRAIAGRVDRFAVRFAPDVAARDRVYPLLTRLPGDAHVIHLPSILPTMQARVEVICARGQRVMAERTIADCGGRRRRVRVFAGAQYVYVGPRDSVTDLGYAWFVAADAAPALSRGVQSALRTSLDDHTAGLGIPLAEKPVVVAAQFANLSPNGYAWRGDTTNRFMFLRFEGPAWSRDDPQMARIVDTFVRHEVFHFWPGAFDARLHPTGRSAWLVEGSAELAGLLSAQKQGVIDANELAATLSRYLNECRDVLGAEPLAGPRGESGHAPYACGTIVQWIASAAGADAISARFFSIWRALADDATDAFSAESFLRRIDGANPARARAVESIVTGSGESRWSELPGLLETLGLHVATRAPDARVLRSRLLLSVLAPLCSGPFGFYEREGFVTLDTGTRCAPLPENPDVDSVDGVNFFRAPTDAYERAAVKCARGEPLTLSRGGNALQVDCRRPLPAPIEFRVAPGGD